MKRDRGCEKVAATRFSLRIREKSRAINRVPIEEIKRLAKQRYRNMPNDEKKNTVDCASDTDLLGIIKMLISKNEQVSVENFEKIIPSFDGNNMSEQYWFENYERNADAYGLNERQKYVHARNKITGEAQLFLESVAISSYIDLKAELCAEFETTLDSETVHQQLQKRKIRDNETFREYVLQMKKIAAQGKIEESALVKYVVSGSGLRKSAKYLMYSSKSIKQLYDNYESVLRTEAEDEKKPSYNQDNYKKQHNKRCKRSYQYKAGDLVAIKRTQFVAGRKLASSYLGPYTITKVKENNRYDVKKAAACEGPKETSTSSDNMKLWMFITNNEEILSSGSDDEDQDGRV